MISTIARNELSSASRQALPTAPFPRKYIHSVFNNQQEALQAAQSLRNAGYDASNIHILTYADYVEAIERGHTLFSSFTSTDLDIYLNVARQGRAILAVRPANRAQMEQVRDLLAPHGAHLMRYIDTWTVAQLLP